MLGADRDALYCDLAETYGILDWQGLSAERLAVLAAGLRDDSRIKRRLSGANTTLTEQLLAVIADRLGTLVWFLSEDGQSGVGRPPSIYQAITGPAEQEARGLLAFSSPEEFEAAWETATGVRHYVER